MLLFADPVAPTAEPEGGLAERLEAILSHAVAAPGDAGVTVRLGVTRQGEEREIKVETIDRYRYLKLDTTY